MENLQAGLNILHEFIEDSAVVVAVPYLLARGRTLSVLFNSQVRRRDQILLGAILGTVSVAEMIFDRDRYPSLTDTLDTGFAALAGGRITGTVCAVIVSAGAIALHPWPGSLFQVAETFATLAVCLAMRRMRGGVLGPGKAFLAGILSQTAALLIDQFTSPAIAWRTIDWHSAAAVVGNGVGMVITTTVFREAWVRTNSERNRLAAEQARAEAISSQLAATEAKLAALRGRIHPHFLYNALASISAMCSVAPDQAEEATAELGDLMRRTLDAGIGTTVTLNAEIDYAKLYLSIEQRRFGPRLNVVWDVDPACASIKVPPFSIQTLVENAVRHGATPLVRPVTITVTVRRRRGRATVAVRDDGRGFTRPGRLPLALDDRTAVHGLQILANQLIILFGRTARVRIFGAPNAGTLAIFAVPMK